MEKCNGLEMAFLVDYDGWDDAGEYCLQFYDAVLNQDIGEFKKGQKIDTVAIDFQKSLLKIYIDDRGNSIDFSIELKLK